MPGDQMSIFRTLLKPSIGVSEESSPTNPIFPASAIAWYNSTTETSSGLLRRGDLQLAPVRVFCLAEELKIFLQEEHIRTSYREGLLYFTFDKGWGEKLRSTRRASELAKATLDLVKMVIFSLPDPYSDPLWELTSSHCGEVFRTTVLPYFITCHGNELKMLEADDDM